MKRIALMAVFAGVLFGAAMANAADGCYANGKRYSNGAFVNGDNGRQIQCNGITNSWENSNFDNNYGSSSYDYTGSGRSSGYSGSTGYSESSGYGSYGGGQQYYRMKTPVINTGGVH